MRLFGHAPGMGIAAHLVDSRTGQASGQTSDDSERGIWRKISIAVCLKIGRQYLRRRSHMKKLQSQSGLTSSVQKLSGIDIADASGKNTALARILSTREVRQTLAAILPDALRVFAGDSPFRKFLMRLVGNYLNKSLSRPEDVFEKSELKLLFEDEKFICDIAGPMPDIINGLFDLIAAATGAIENLETGKKEEFLGELATKLATGQTGILVTQGCRILNDIHKDDPEFFTRNLAPGFKKWIESVDFGELKEMVENSSADARAFVVMANDALWQYPAKVMLLLSLLPNIINGITSALDISLAKMNDLPPDLITDVILSYIQEMDSKSMANLSNQLAELARKIHTGSALLGEPGSPQLPKLLASKLNEIISAIDPVTFWKAKVALAELSASFNKGLTEAVNDTPALKQLAMIKGPEIANIQMKSLNQKLSLWEAVDDEELAKSLANHLSAYDIQEMTEVVNNLLRIFNRLGDGKPDLYAELIRQLTAGIDGYELAQAGNHVFNGAGKELRPLARAVAPKIISWLCDVIAPADDEFEDDAAQARQSLRFLFAKEEV